MTAKREVSDADICRQNGWRRGTRLEGYEYGERAVIQITAVGDDQILARQISPEPEPELSWTLSCRKWRRVSR
jgi:hypothetical protein